MKHFSNAVRFAAAVVMALYLVWPAGAQQCDDFNGCTANDMCSGGTCTGTPASGGSCDDFNECTVNDQCVDLGAGPFCMGDPAPVGTECQGGCGSCESLLPFPVPGVPLTCSPKPGSVGQACEPMFGDDLGPCYPARCMAFGVPGFEVAVCSVAPILCPDTDGNPCTDACNFENGQCQRIERPCGYPECGGRCDPATGNCVSNNEGRACDDLNECTAESRCDANGVCAEGAPTPGGDATPTPTGTAVAATPTVSPQATPTMPTGPVCVGDCNGDGRVVISETITAVNIGLETLALSACPAADANGNGAIAINELILSVGNGLNDCPA